MNLFYPSHDIALANGVRHFNPPAAAQMLQEDLASLSDIWNLPYTQGEWPMPLPWGWDWDTRKHLHEAYGVKMTQLPTDADLEALRSLSSRQTTTQLCRLLEAQIPGSVSYWPAYLDSQEGLFSFIREQNEQGRRFVLKSPWSSSGRGLFCSHSRGRDGALSPVSREQLLQQGTSVIRKMGGVMGEQWIEDKERDFAMLFFASQSQVRFVGYSLFDNDEGANSTTYRQGFLLSNERIEQLLTHGDASLTAHLRAIAHAYEGILTELLRPFLGHAWQVGYLGIDMLTYRPKQGSLQNATPPNPLPNDAPQQSVTPPNLSTHNDPQQSVTPPNLSTHDAPLQIHPCVELNLRCTMGVVCRLWYEQHLQEGTFRISPMQQNRHFNYEFLPTL